MKSVIKNWLSSDNISLKQQTIILSALRGEDNISKTDICRKLTKKIRSVVLEKTPHHESTFMKNDMTLEEVRMMTEDYNKYSLHFYIHIMHACEIIGYKHYDKEIRDWFNSAYLIMVNSLHLKPETEKECDKRLRD